LKRTIIRNILAPGFCVKVKPGEDRLALDLHVKNPLAGAGDIQFGKPKLHVVGTDISS